MISQEVRNIDNDLNIADTNTPITRWRVHIQPTQT